MNLISNAFRSTEKLKELEVYTFTPKIPLSPDETYGICKALVRYLSNFGFPAGMRGSTIYCINNRTDRKEVLKHYSISNKEFIRSDDKIKINVREFRSTFEEILNNLFKRNAKFAKFDIEKSPKLHYSLPYKSDFFDEYEAITYTVDVYKDGDIHIWIDPTKAIAMPFKRYINELKKDGLSDEEIKNKVTNMKVYCPLVSRCRNASAKVYNYNFNKIKEHTFSIDDITTNLYDYWTSQNKHRTYLKIRNKSLEENEEGIVSVKYNDNFDPIDFPMSLCDMMIDISDPTFTKHSDTYKSNYTELERVEKTKDIAKRILSKGLKIEEHVLKFDLDLLNWNDSDIGEPIELEVPELEFSENHILRPERFGKLNILDSLKNYGPISKKEEIKCAVVCPPDFNDLSEELINNLSYISQDLNLSRLKLIRIDSVKFANANSYNYTCSLLEDIKNEIDIVLVVLPKFKYNECYFDAKKSLGELELPSQMIQHGSFWKLTKYFDKNNERNLSLGSNVVCGIYDKCLNQGEALWQLHKPAGNLDPDKITYFMGFDVSRNIEKNTESGAYAAICDPFGRVLHRKHLGGHRGEKINPNILTDWFFKVAIQSYKESERKKPLNTLVLFKDGNIPDNQIKDYQKASEIAKENMLQHDLIAEDGNIVILEVVKRGPQRLYGDEKNNYRISNKAVIRSDTEALIVTYGNTYKKSPKPLRLSIISQLENEFTIRDIVQMFNHLRYLDYSSIYSQPKTILPLHIVQNQALLNKEDINVPYVAR